MNAEGNIKIWDPFVRLFHWTLVTAVGLAFITEDEWMTLHLAAGLTVLMLLSGRLAWGIIGTPHARFTDFVATPGGVLAYLRALARGQAPRHVGHNPAGGLMVVVLLMVLLATTLSGLLVWNDVHALPILGPYLSGYSATTVSALESLHETLSNTLLVLIVLHLAGVVLASLQHRENLVGAMLHGRKRLQR